MNENILNEAKKFLVSYLKGKNIDYETIHPWRKGWEFIVLHSFRVEGYVKRILDRENHDLSNDEILLTQLGAILHDIGRIVKREDHSLIGRDIVNDWLKNNASIRSTIKEPDRLLHMIEKHSFKEAFTDDYCLKVLRDADVLDEIGVMSIFMTSNWIDRNNPYYFKLLYDRVQNFEINFCNKGFKLLNTESAKQILNEKKEFITLVNNHLKDELYGTGMFGEVNIEDYFNNI